MKPKDLQKMCAHCDGRIPIEAVECPYCAAVVGQEKSAPSSPAPFSHQSLNDSLASLYTPPYAARGQSSQGQAAYGQAQYSEEKKDFTMKKNDMLGGSSPYSMGSPSIASEEQAEEKQTSAFWPIFLLSLGGNLLLMGLLQFFFSDGGKLRLEWDSSYWFVYALASFPILYFGIKKAGSLN